MATNRRRVVGRMLNIAVTDGGVASGDPCICGKIAGVATRAKDGSNVTTVDTQGVYSLSVQGTTGSNSAVAVGDVIYYVSGNTPKLSKTTSGVKFGYALGTVASGDTGTIDVKLTGGDN